MPFVALIQIKDNLSGDSCLNENNILTYYQLFRCVAAVVVDVVVDVVVVVVDVVDVDVDVVVDVVETNAGFAVLLL